MENKTGEDSAFISLSLTRFILVFIFMSFIVKILVEIIHEIFGHGLVVLLAGGKINSFTISWLWPLELSSISWHLPSDITPLIRGCVIAGGIFACIITYFSSLAVLHFIQFEKRIFLTIFLIWLTFWSLLNSTGYLIIGGLSPFGDISQLIQLGFLTQLSSLLLGLGLFGIGFVLLSINLDQFFSIHYSANKEYFVVIFWGLVPFLTFLTILGYNFPLYVIFPSFIPMGATLIYYFTSKDVIRA